MLRREAYRLARQLCRSLDEEPDRWSFQAAAYFQVPQIYRGHISIVPQVGFCGLLGPSATVCGPLTPARIPIQRVVLRVHDSEVWLPLLARLRLRRAVRRFLLRKLAECLDAPDQAFAE